MSNQELKLAQEWAAEYSGNLVYHKAQAAVNVIQSLPDQWVDAEKARALIASLNAWAEDADAERSHGRALGYRTAAENLATLLPAPSLPTLANMTQEEREACKWMQAKASGSDDLYILANVSTPGTYLWTQDGHVIFRGNDEITPITTLPKFKWPGHDEALPKDMRLADHTEYGRVVVSPKRDSDGEYKIFYSDEDSNTGACYEYASKPYLDFLDTNTTTK